MNKWVCLVLGGVVGTGARYGLGEFVTKKVGAGFPWGTLAVNVSGCFVVGFLDTLFQKKFQLSPHYRVLLITGFCGAFTTFSTFMMQTSQLWKETGPVPALANVGLSLGLGFGAFVLGEKLAFF